MPYVQLSYPKDQCLDEACSKDRRPNQVRLSSYLSSPKTRELEEYPENQVRLSSYLSSPKTRELEEYPEVKVVKDPKIWKYVQDVLPQKF
uniref:Uncharacterized protein n=1 Tax=Megaselia scalaris TaxID=36166 RepID=T1GHA9_MEGSC